MNDYPLNKDSVEASSNPPQASCPDTKSFQSFHLIQISSKAQILTFDQPHPTHPIYSIEAAASFSFTNHNSFLNHKPDLAIVRQCNNISQKVADGNFEKNGPTSRIKYHETKKVEELRLEDYQTQRTVGTIDGMPWASWQPSQVDNLLVEIVAPTNELIARFVYSNVHNFTDKLIKFNTVLGELQVDQQYVCDLTVLDQVVCTTVTLVEREKRRLHKLIAKEETAPAASWKAGISHAEHLGADGPAPSLDDRIIR